MLLFWCCYSHGLAPTNSVVLLLLLLREAVAISVQRTLLFASSPCRPKLPLGCISGDSNMHPERLTAKQCAVPAPIYPWEVLQGESPAASEKTHWQGCLSGDPCCFFSWLATGKSFPFPFSFSFPLSLFFLFLCPKQLSASEQLFAISCSPHA